MDPIVLFFLFGLLGGIFKCDIKFSESVSELMMILLLITIGLKGGMELHNQDFLALLPKILAVTSLGVILPLIAFPILYKLAGISRIDAASMAAHYGSVSVGTFAVCIAFLNNNNVTYEPYVSLFVIILEIPAIIVGLTLAHRGQKETNLTSILKETLRSKAVILLAGGLLIGWISGKEKLEPYNALFVRLFYGVLAMFLIDMGRTVSIRLKEVKEHGFFILAFGILMPLFSGCLGIAVGTLAGLSIGGTVVVSLLAASASYIAVPAAMKMSLPKANLSLSLGSSLGVTFPFNVVVGIPLFYQITLFIRS